MYPKEERRSIDLIVNSFLTNSFYLSLFLMASLLNLNTYIVFNDFITIIINLRAIRFKLFI